jgi:hypothetical protein
MTDWKENLFSWSKENEELAFKAFCRFLKERDLSACAEFKPMFRILRAYSSGSLIEAKTEGEISAILCEAFGKSSENGIIIPVDFDYKGLSHALVGKV